jgi:AraC-like DNA-binding protein
MGIGIHGHRLVEKFLLPDTWSLHLYQYRARIKLGSLELTIEPGKAILVPAGQAMTYHFSGPGCKHHYALFQLEKAGKPFMARLFKKPDELSPIWKDNFKSATEVFWENPLLASVGLWHSLLRWVEKEKLPQVAPGQPLVNDAVDYFRRNLNRPLKIAEVASGLGVSHNLMLLRFRQSLGISPMTWLRKERMSQAKRLLEETRLPIKIVAEECGYRDLQLFNKSIRAFFGKSPRNLRLG